MKGCSIALEIYQPQPKGLHIPRLELCPNCGEPIWEQDVNYAHIPMVSTHQEMLCEIWQWRKGKGWKLAKSIRTGTAHDAKN
jgi:hypothetical protein